MFYYTILPIFTLFTFIHNRAGRTSPTTFARLTLPLCVGSPRSLKNHPRFSVLRSLLPLVANTASHSLASSPSTSLTTGQEGLEPPTYGFGVRRSTIRATALYIYHQFSKKYLKIYLVCYYFQSLYSIMSETTPAPTVRPPSRTANLLPFSIAIGEIRSTSILTSSPGITISLSFGRTTDPVTSVVRK